MISPEKNAAHLLAMGLRWDTPSKINNWCWACKTPLIEYYISNEDGKAHLSCEYYGLKGDGFLKSFPDKYGLSYNDHTRDAQEYAKEHYMRMICIDSETYIGPIEEQEIKRDPQHTFSFEIDPELNDGMTIAFNQCGEPWWWYMKDENDAPAAIGSPDFTNAKFVSVYEGSTPLFENENPRRAK